jgi:hypothetical protein
MFDFLDGLRDWVEFGHFLTDMVDWQIWICTWTGAEHNCWLRS